MALLDWLSPSRSSRLLASWWSKHPMRIRDESPDEFAIRTIAWMMIIVAVLLAITVYGTSVAEHGVAQLERRLAQAQVLESAFREAGRLIGGRFQMGAARAQDLHARSAVLRESAARLRGVPRPRPENPAADELEMLAQEDEAVYRLFSTMKLGSVLEPEPQALNGLVEELVTAGLKGFGLGPKLSGRRSSKAKARLPVSGTSEADPTGDVTPAAANRNGLTAQIEQKQQEVVSRATAVVAFVGSLVFFTFAGMASGQTRVFVALTGVVVGGLTAGIMLFRVPASVTEHGIQAVAIVLLVSFFSAGRSALAMSALSNPLEPGEHDIHSHTRHIFAGHARSPFSRRLVVGIAITALLSAMTDYWYTEASVIENKASQEAFAHESDFTRGLLDWTTSRVQLFDTATQVLETRQRLGVAAARSELGYLRSGVDRALAQAAVWDAKLRGYEQTYPALLHWLDDPIRGLQGSAPFYQADSPWNIPTAVVGNPTFFRSWAPWDAANERAIRAHQSMTALLRALTLFAIALYFLGQALGLGEGSASRLLFRVGIILMLVGGAWSGLSEWYATLAAEVWPGTERCPAFGVDPTRPAADRARVAAEYFYRAHRDRIDGAMQNAARGFDCAIEVRPNFSAARSGRLDILESQYVSGGSPRLTRGFVTSSGTPAAFIFNQYMPGWSSWGYNDRRVVNDVLTRVIRMGFLSGAPPVRYDCPGASKEWPIYGRSWLDASGVVYAALR